MTNPARVAVVLIGLLLALVVVTVVAHPELSAAVSALAAVTTATISTVALGQVRRDSRNSSRPMVAASLRPARPVGQENALTRAAQELVVRNYGPSIARDVVVSFEPVLQRSPGLTDLVELYSRPVPVLVPEGELVNVWAGPTAEETPEHVTATIRYTDADGVAYGPERFLLDVRVVRHRTYLEGHQS